MHAVLGTEANNPCRKAALTAHLASSLREGPVVAGADVTVPSLTSSPRTPRQTRVGGRGQEGLRKVTGGQALAQARRALKRQPPDTRHRIMERNQRDHLTQGT
ncbi:hypothetical protein ACIG3E_37400 [Streptomyces sp. NPDC053474]|uniref:hypothetical protein n=1 Tax=Streptomyces sp. NPDC053474 TaxID=3365704 RepID=UPI0037CD42C9